MIDFERLEPNTVFICKTTEEMDKLKPRLDAIGKKFYADSDGLWNRLKSDFEGPLGFYIGATSEAHLTYSHEGYFRHPPVYCRDTFHIINVSEIEFENEKETKMKLNFDFDHQIVIVVHGQKDFERIQKCAEESGKNTIGLSCVSECEYGIRVGNGGVLGHANLDWYQRNGYEIHDISEFEIGIESDGNEGNEVNESAFDRLVKKHYLAHHVLVMKNEREETLLMDALTRLGYKWNAGQAPHGYSASSGRGYPCAISAIWSSTTPTFGCSSYSGPEGIQISDLLRESRGIEDEGGFTATFDEERQGYVRDDTGEFVDKEEFESKFALCYECEKYFDIEDMTEDESGNLYCEDCKDEHLYECCECGAWVRDDDVVYCEYNDRYYCESCADDELGYCERCEQYVPLDEMIESSDTHEHYCRDCAENYWRVCDDCGEWFANEDNVYYNEYEERDYCERCYPEHNHGGVGSYHSHNMESSQNFYLGEGEKRGEVVILGAEHEVDNVCDMDALTNDLDDEFDGFYVYEDDGSLGCDGVEIISHPASLSEHLKRLPKLREICRSQGAVSHNSGNCGLHIHIDRAYLDTESSIAKLCFLFERHWDNLRIFARRTEGQLHWCKRDSEAFGGMSPAKIAKADKERHGYGMDRYCAINLTPRNTVEIRLWRGTLNLTTMKATFKLTARLAELAKNTPIAKLYKMKWEDILGDDEDIKAYWETRVPATVPDAYDAMVENDDDPGEDD